jgi:hypothetical protein
MSMNHRYRPTARFETAKRKVERRLQARDAILGDETGQVDDLEIGYHLVRFAASADVNNNATFGPVFRVRANPGAGYYPVAGRRVRIQLLEEGEWEVVKGDFKDMVEAGIDPRGANPNDPYRAFRYLDELVDLSSRGIGDGLIVQVQGWKYYTANYAYKHDIGTDATTQLDLTSSLPGGADTHRYAVVVFNITQHLASNPPWEVYNGTAIANTTALSEADIQTAFDLFPTDERIVPIMAYYLEYGQTEIKGPAYNVDLRTAWNLFGVIDGEVALPKLAPGTPNKYIGFDGSGNPTELDGGGAGDRTPPPFMSIRRGRLMALPSKRHRPARILWSLRMRLTASTRRRRPPRLLLGPLVARDTFLCKTRKHRVHTAAHSRKQQMSPEP